MYCICLLNVPKGQKPWSSKANSFYSVRTFTIVNVYWWTPNIQVLFLPVNRAPRMMLLGCVSTYACLMCGYVFNMCLILKLFPRLLKNNPLFWDPFSMSSPVPAQAGRREGMRPGDELVLPLHPNWMGSFCAFHNFSHCSAPHHQLKLGWWELPNPMGSQTAVEWSGNSPCGPELLTSPWHAREWNTHSMMWV